MQQSKLFVWPGTDTACFSGKDAKELRAILDRLFSFCIQIRTFYQFAALLPYPLRPASDSPRWRRAFGELHGVPT